MNDLEAAYKDYQKCHRILRAMRHRTPSDMSWQVARDAFADATERLYWAQIRADKADRAIDRKLLGD